MSLTYLLIVSLVVYRITRFIVADTFFEGTRERLKDWAFIDDQGTYRPIKGHPHLTTARGKLGDLLTCPFCVSVHVAGWTYLAVELDRGWSSASVLTRIVEWLALAAGAIVIWNLTEKEE